MDTQDRIIDLLKAGISQSAVARACGVTESYVSQLMADENIRAEVTEAKVAKVEGALRTDELIENLELSALEQMEAKLQYVTKPMELVRIFQTLNAAKKKATDIIPSAGGPTAAIVTINISAAAALQFKMDAVQQVVEVEGRSMATLPAKALQQKLSERVTQRPQITDAKTAANLLDQLEMGIPTLAHEL